MSVARKKKGREPLRTSVPIRDVPVIKRAAATERMTVSAFIARSAAREAERVLENEDTRKAATQPLAGPVALAG